MRKYYVYTITNTINLKKYVGITSSLKKRKWQHFSSLRRGVHSNYLLQDDFNKYGEEAFITECIDECLEPQKSEYEKMYISKLKTSNPDFGYNLTSGGVTGYVLTEIARSKMSDAMLENASAVIQLDESGVVVNRYKNAKSASSITGMNYTNILRCCNGTQAHIFKTQWCYEEDLPNREGKSITPSKRFRRVVQLSLTGEYIKTYDRVSEALMELGLNEKDGSHLSGCCSGKRCSFYGFIWMYLEDYTPENVLKKIKAKDSAMTNTPKKVLLLDGNYAVIDEYDTLTIASKKLCLSPACISTACNKKRPTKDGLNLLFESDYNEIINNGGLNNE